MKVCKAHGGTAPYILELGTVDEIKEDTFFGFLSSYIMEI
jgi:hypothetical protein